MNVISKTMIFIDTINERITLIKYLYTKFFKNLKNKRDLIIQYFHLNPLNKSKSCL